MIRWTALAALPLVAGCAIPGQPMPRPYPVARPPEAVAPAPVQGQRTGPTTTSGRTERYSGQFDGGRITLAISPAAEGRVQVVASSPRQPPCTIEWRSAGTWSGDVLILPNGITLTRVGPTLEMSEGEGGSPSCTLQGTLRRI
ncbi:hypothetical protein VQH23_12210 [Pararoseomonas sp. SCSIO 73927]|uniref:hypothetical protein n=1 Tax=Pararoseomonas sp. SCSIO 73927 TaxID=3114537 RepID=UPI0030D4AEA5